MSIRKNIETIKLTANFMLRSILIFFSFIILTPAFAQDLNFYKESISFKIEEGWFYVSGEYFLKSTDSSKKLLFYPFPTDSIYGEVDSVLIFDLSREEKIEAFKISDRGLYFNFMADSLVKTRLQISYRQKLLGNRAEYILLTTRAWGKAFEKANYQLIVPPGIEVTGFSYSPDKKVRIDGETIYFWTKYSFMPDKNMILTFNIHSTIKNK